MSGWRAEPTAELGGEASGASVTRTCHRRKELGEQQQARSSSSSSSSSARVRKLPERYVAVALRRDERELPDEGGAQEDADEILEVRWAPWRGAEGIA